MNDAELGRATVALIDGVIEATPLLYFTAWLVDLITRNWLSGVHRALAPCFIIGVPYFLLGLLTLRDSEFALVPALIATISIMGLVGVIRIFRVRAKEARAEMLADTAEA